MRCVRYGDGGREVYDPRHPHHTHAGRELGALLARREPQAKREVTRHHYWQLIGIVALLLALLAIFITLESR